MDTVINVLVVLEMALTNMIVFSKGAHRKYSLLATMGILALYTAFLVGGAYQVLQFMPGFGNGNGLFALAGMLYLLPLYYLYEENLRKTVSIVCSSWIYTMIIFSLAVNIAKVVSPENFRIWALRIQTCLYIATVLIFLKWMQKKFLYILENLTASTESLFMASTLLWFLSAVVLQMAFVYSGNIPLKVLAMVAFAASVFVSFVFIYRLVDSIKNEGSLLEIVYLDGLTGLRNRNKFFVDAGHYIKEGKKFLLIYMDLDNFKYVNDKYGHKAGDEYLCSFANYIKTILGSQGTAYRLAGDEFVCLITQGEDKALEIQELLRRIRGKKGGLGIPFQGCSAGYSCFPQDGTDLDQLLQLADRNMYTEKGKRK